MTVVAREAARARGVLEDEGVDVVELNLVGEEKASDDDLRNALSGEFCWCRQLELLNISVVERCVSLFFHVLFYPLFFNNESFVVCI